MNPLDPATAVRLALSDGMSQAEAEGDFLGQSFQVESGTFGGTRRGVGMRGVFKLTAQQEHAQIRNAYRRMWEDGDIDEIPVDYR